MSLALDPIDHIAIPVADIADSVQWYRRRFRCEAAYQDETWALLRFKNAKLALVTPSQHPPHIGFVSPLAEEYGALQPHRDGRRSTYIRDPGGNAMEVLAPYESGGD